MLHGIRVPRVAADPGGQGPGLGAGQRSRTARVSTGPSAPEPCGPADSTVSRWGSRTLQLRDPGRISYPPNPSPSCAEWGRESRLPHNPQGYRGLNRIMPAKALARCLSQSYRVIAVGASNDGNGSNATVSAVRPAHSPPRALPVGRRSASAAECARCLRVQRDRSKEKQHGGRWPDTLPLLRWAPRFLPAP